MRVRTTYQRSQVSSAALYEPTIRKTRASTVTIRDWCTESGVCCTSYNENLWIGDLFEGAAYLPR